MPAKTSKAPSSKKRSAAKRTTKSTKSTRTSQTVQPVLSKREEKAAAKLAAQRAKIEAKEKQLQERAAAQQRKIEEKAAVKEAKLQAKEAARAKKLRAKARKKKGTASNKNAAQRKPAAVTNTQRAPQRASATKNGAKRRNAANVITVIRIVLAFVWLGLFELFIEPPSVLTLTTTRFAEFSIPILIFAGAFFIIALTDCLDGYFARKHNDISNFGVFLDPIADKILVLCGLLLLMQYGYINIWVVIIIASREFLVGGLRMCVAEKGVIIAANGLGKAKTILTMSSIIGFLIYMALPPLLLATIVIFWLSQIILMFAIFFTIWSGLEYYAEFKKYI